MSMQSANGSSAQGLGFVGALTVLFVGLKLTHHIDWSWWWVLSPVWICATFVVGLMLTIVVLVAVDR